MRQKGFAALVFILLISLSATSVVLGIYYVKTLRNPKPQARNPIITSATSQPSISPIQEPNQLTPPSLTPKPTTTPTPILENIPIPTSIQPIQAPSFSSIKITGDDICVTQTKQALDILKEKAVTHYDTTNKYIGVIECTESGSGMYAWETPPRFQIGLATRQAGSIWYAGTIAHDSCHSKLYHDYLSNNLSTMSVPENVWIGEEAENECLNVQYDALKDIGADDSTLNYVKGIISSGYWNINYNNRWW